MVEQQQDVCELIRVFEYMLALELILLILMLPQSSPYSYNQAPNPGQYSFDLKVNVDLQSGKIGLGVPPKYPHGAPPFARKPQVPVGYSQPYQQLPPSRPPVYNAPYQDMTSSYPPVAPYPHPQQYHPNEHIFASAHSPYPIQNQPVRYHSPNYKAFSALDTYPDTYNSFSVNNVERSYDDVNCVICDKPINRASFQAHLEQHKARKKQYEKKQARERNETKVKNDARVKQQNSGIGSFAVRNQNSLENLNEMYQQSSRNSMSLDPKGNVFSRTQKGSSSKHSFSRQISDTHSRIVYAPRDPSRMVSGSNQSQFSYSHSSGFQSNHPQQNVQQHQQQNAIEFSNHRPSVTSSQQRSSQQAPTQQNLYNSRNVPALQQSRRQSSNLLPNDISKKLEEQRMRASRMDSSFHSQKNAWGVQSSKKSSSRNQGSKFSSNTSGIFEHNKTKSRYVGKQKKTTLEDFNESIIHHLKDFSTFSRDSNLGELHRQLEIHKIQQEESSSDEEYSNRPNPSVRMQTSVGAGRSQRMEESKTLGLNRTKLPLNYLALEQFIQDPMYYSCYRSTHRF